MAEVVLTERVAAAGLADEVDVVSAGTGDWHVGKPMDRRAAALLTAHGYDAGRHRAQQFDVSWFDECDLILAMDGQNRRDLEELGVDRDEPERLLMFRDFDPRAGDDRDVPDPYYGDDDGFETVLAMITRTSDHLVSALTRERVD
jgi:protein-tyrosine phosphatase